MMDFLMAPESHDPGLDRRAGDLELAHPPHDRLI